jgi:hypothetical protein
MVPVAALLMMTSVGFPRLRGDGPDARFAAPIRNGVPPPTRGWSRWGTDLTDGAEALRAEAGRYSGPLTFFEFESI